jgi:SAM-dependent methyltransferase
MGNTMTPDERIDLAAMNPTGRFSDRAQDYRRYRPDYPAAALEAILEGLGDPAAWLAADVGAGTGISARQLAARGVRVHAVEPNAEMRAAAEAHERVTWHAGTAEATGLETASVDLVLCAQAFHWFRLPDALAEFHRILKPGARLAVMWNARDRSDALTRGYTEAIEAVDGDDPLERMRFEPAAVAGSGFFAIPAESFFPHAQLLDRKGLLGRASSASYVPRDGERFARLEASLDALWEREHDANGNVTLRYVTKLYRAARV